MDLIDRENGYGQGYGEAGGERRICEMRELRLEEESEQLMTDKKLEELPARLIIFLFVGGRQGERERGGDRKIIPEGARVRQHELLVMGIRRGTGKKESMEKGEGWKIRAKRREGNLWRKLEKS